jgi:hypothetical protein
VDDATVTIENIDRHLAEGKPTLEAIRDGAGQIATPACFRDENGRQRRITTKETNSKKALKISEEFESAVKTKRTLSLASHVQ